MSKQTTSGPNVGKIVMVSCFLLSAVLFALGGEMTMAMVQCTAVSVILMA